LKALTFLARRFVAGEAVEDAVAVGRRLHERGIRATFDLLGEDVLDRDAAHRCAEADKALIRAIPDGIDRNISIKLTTMGLDISEELCLELASGVLTAARAAAAFVRIDMEGSKHTQRTLEVFRKLRKDYDNVGIVLQAYLHRTEDDLKDAVARKDRVRLCKGAYSEPPSIAWKDMEQIRASYRRLAHLLLDQGNYPALASHDESLVQDAIAYARDRGIPADRFEFQMLYGLRPKRWEELVRDGYNVRIYVPFGTHWIPYFYRRLRERKDNVFFVLRNLLRG
jgi:proline dehydrogenase